MSQLSQREAARAWGVGRATLQRAIASGKLSVTGDKLIDPTEMVRVFGEPKRPAGPARAGPNEPDESTPGPPGPAVKIAQLEAENAALRELVQRADAERDRALGMVRLLTHDTPGKPRRWWQWGRS